MGKSGKLSHKVGDYGIYSGCARHSHTLYSHMTHLIGNYMHTMDQKRRVSLPAKLRPSLGASVFVTLGYNKNVAIYSKQEWDLFTSEMDTLPRTDKSVQDFRKFFIATANEVEIDSTGRILLPEHLCEFGSLKEKVCFVGMLDWIEIWDKDIWTNHYEKDILKNSDIMFEKVNELMKHKK